MAKKQKKNNSTNNTTLMKKVTNHVSLPKKMPNMHMKGMKMNKTTGAVGVGAVVGAMAGSAVGYALSDTQRRKAMLDKMQQLKNYVMRTLDELQVMSDDMDQEETNKKRMSQNGKSKRHYQSASI